MVDKAACKQAICDKLIELAREEKDIVVLTSDSRGSASMTRFGEELPEQLVEVGIAEQNIVGLAAGLAASGKKPFIASYAAFLTMRSIEQIKVDVAYSGVNVAVIGISGGLSYGPLGMSHHAVQDIAVMRAIPGIDVILPADQHESRKMIEKLVKEPRPVYVRVGRNPVPDIYKPDNQPEFEIGKAVTIKKGGDLTFIACGKMVSLALEAASELEEKGVSCRVINMHTLKPLDEEAIIAAARETGAIITIEEHSIHGGLGSAVAEVVVQHEPVPVRIMGIPDTAVVTGTQEEVFQHYGLDVNGIVDQAKQLLSGKGRF